MPVAVTAPARTRRPWLRLWLIAVGSVQTWRAMSDLPDAVVSRDPTSAPLVLAQRVVSADLLIAPLIAGLALAFAVVGRARQAVHALATLLLVAWVADLPSLAIHGLTLSLDLGGLQSVCAYVVRPAIAITAIFLAAHDRRLPLAGLVVSLPTIAAWLSAAAFVLGVTIFGV